jgi:D-psicose/D-tagatose/L-ribulose 3-epimerase
MRISLCNEVIASLPFAQQAKLAAGLGYDGLEVAPFTLDADAPHLLPAARRAELRRIAAEEGAPITSLHWLLVAPAGLSITTADAATRKRTLDVMQRLVDLAADLGATLLVHGSPKQRQVVADGDAQRAEDAMAQAGAWAAQHGLTYCLEPLDAGQTNWARTVAEAVEIVTRLDVPGLATMLDVSAAGDEAAQQGGDSFRPVLDALIDTNYAGFCAVEPFDYHPDGATSAARAIGYLRGILEE